MAGRAAVCLAVLLAGLAHAGLAGAQAGADCVPGGSSGGSAAAVAAGIRAFV